MAFEVRDHVPLSPLTTLGVGGPARHYVRADSDAALVEALSWARAKSLPVAVLGGGSNLVVSDRGVPGLVLHVASRGIEVEETPGSVVLHAAAGEDWDSLVAMAVTRGWTGLECLSGIPGRVGATPIQNVGAYGQEVADAIETVEALDRVTLETRKFSGRECAFSYRRSRFKAQDRDRYVILRVSFRLATGGSPVIRYAELERELESRGTRREPGDVRQAVLAVRRRKSMVLDPADPESRSVGSFFMNPIVSESRCGEIEGRLRAGGTLADGERLPAFQAGTGEVKLAAAWLIERAGFHKGEARGAVGLSRNHALAIVNRGGGTAADVLRLAREIRDRVAARFGISLVPEPVFWGEGP